MRNPEHGFTKHCQLTVVKIKFGKHYGKPFMYTITKCTEQVPLNVCDDNEYVN